MKLLATLLLFAFVGTAHAAPATLILKNQFGEQSNNTVLSTGTFGGYGVYVQRLSVTFAQLNTATSGVALSLGVALPDKAIIRQVYYNVRTTFADSGTAGDADTSTLSIGANTNVDLKAAVTIANGANAWDAGIGAGIPVGTAATMVKTTAARNIKVVWTAGTGNATSLTAGAMDIFVEYVYGQ
ncbi:hypothetical protein UFOVP558_19 [uncultured Caudovirales phage]|uniref:Uncharacterized protein n=1 Tax=uncultured Caudovirales phage TaxID=2100421 RepID=A0A6J5MUL5_9CAUD|nr:hypothetical protein UFOVP558_19 [uncultured Caudovirales phage]